MTRSSSLILLFLLWCHVGSNMSLAASLEVAKNYYANRQFAEARVEALALMQENVNSSILLEARFIAADCLFELASYDEFMAEVASYRNDFSDQTSHSMTLVLHQAMIPMNRHQVEQALSSLRQFKIDYPASQLEAEADYNILLILASNRRKSEFANEYAAFKTRFADKTNLLEALAYYEVMLEYNLGNWEAAESGLAEFIAGHPDSPHATEADFHRIWSILSGGDSARFLSEAEAFTNAHPEAGNLNDTLAFLKAMIPYQNGDVQGAIDQLRVYSTNHPNSSHAVEADFYYLWTLYSNQRDDEFLAAEPTFRAKYSDRADYLAKLDFARAMVPYHRRQWGEAVQKLEQFIESHPGYDNLLEVRYWLAMGRIEQAKLLQRQGQQDHATSAMQGGLLALSSFKEDCASAIQSNPNMDVRRRHSYELLLLHAGYRSADYQNAVNQAREYVQRYNNASLEWMDAMNWLGISLSLITPPNLDEAADTFNAVLAVQNDTPAADKLKSSSIEWLIRNARSLNDEGQVRAYIQKLGQLQDNPIKKRVLQQYGND